MADWLNDWQTGRVFEWLADWLTDICGAGVVMAWRWKRALSVQPFSDVHSNRCGGLCNYSENYIVFIEFWSPTDLHTSLFHAVRAGGREWINVPSNLKRYVGFWCPKLGEKNVTFESLVCTLCTVLKNTKPIWITKSKQNKITSSLSSFRNKFQVSKIIVLFFYFKDSLYVE